MVKEQILSALSPFNFTQVGLKNLTSPISLSFYESWLNEGLNADMKYLKDHLDLKKNLNQFLPQAKSVIVVALDYFNHPKPLPLTSMKAASYAKGEDYHYFFKQKLTEAANLLKANYPDEEFKVSTDSQPILERDFAYQAGLGWFGKNTVLIHQKHGSYFLLGEIVTTLDLNASHYSTPMQNIGTSKLNKEGSLKLDNSQKTINLEDLYHPDRCGTCTKCIDACPTDALTPKKLDANKCISYWTIESKSIPPISLAQKFESWFFGCDICQDVCPWNIKLHGENQIQSKNETSRTQVLKEILEILNSSNKSLEKKFFGTPLSRARGFGLKRNALIVALNIKATEISEDLKNLDLKNEDLNKFKNEVLLFL
jgi:epoxyqueuosine reductase